MIGWKYKTDRKNGMREWLMVGLIKTEGPAETMATMVTSPSSALTGEHKMQRKETICEDFPYIVQEIDS